MVFPQYYVSQIFHVSISHSHSSIFRAFSYVFHKYISNALFACWQILRMFPIFVSLFALHKQIMLPGTSLYTWDSYEWWILESVSNESETILTLKLTRCWEIVFQNGNANERFYKRVWVYVCFTFMPTLILSDILILPMEWIQRLMFPYEDKNSSRVCIGHPGFLFCKSMDCILHCLFFNCFFFFLHLFISDSNLIIYVW